MRTKAHRESWDWRVNGQGKTFNIGSRKSGRFIRIYDRRGPTRLEMEFKGDWAKMVGERIATSSPKYWMWDVMGMLKDYVEFVDSKSGDNISRAPLLPWWKQFIGSCEKVKLQRPSISLSAQKETARLEAHVQRQTASLYIYRHALGVSLDDMVDRSGYKLSALHHAKLKRLTTYNEGKR